MRVRTHASGEGTPWVARKATSRLDTAALANRARMCSRIACRVFPTRDIRHRALGVARQVGHQSSSYMARALIALQPRSTVHRGPARFPGGQLGGTAEGNGVPQDRACVGDQLCYTLKARVWDRFGSFAGPAPDRTGPSSRQHQIGVWGKSLQIEVYGVTVGIPPVWI
jgi:hypothetical protein